MPTARSQHESKSRLLDAGLHVIRAKTYTAATIDDICDYAGLTKGSFFHHFEGTSVHPARFATEAYARATSLEGDIAEAMRKYRIGADWSARSLALHTQAVIQGAFVLAKSKNGPAVAGECLDRLRRYLEPLFDRPNRRR
jgi:AcrR family transcriptional regulator